MSLAELLTELRAEPIECAEARSAAEFDRIASPYQDRVVIFGTAFLGEVALAGLRRAGIEPLAFCDNNANKWNTEIDGVCVLPPAEAVRQYGDSAAFVVAIYNSTKPRQQLRDLGCTRIVPYPVLFWKHWRTMPREDRLELPHRILRRASEMAAGYDLLDDERSRQEFCAQIRWRCLLDYNCLPAPDPASEMYYPRGLVQLMWDEVLVDCGAFDGDSIRLFLEKSGGAFGRIYALEADPKNFAALESNQRTLAAGVAERIELLPYAVAGHDGVLRFSAEGDTGSRVAETGPAIELPCRKLDTLLKDAHPTFIKMDIEGAEPDALEGGREVMAKHRPVMAVCAYHKCDHLWTLPQLLKAGNPDYRIFLRRYAEDCWETVFYAIPPERLPVDTGDAKTS